MTLRQHAARGTIINGAFLAAVTVLAATRGIILPLFLAPEELGLWGILLVALGTLTWLKQIGVADKYVQQDDDDQERAFSRAFTIELMVNGVLLMLLLATVPLVALVYGRNELLLPGFALCLLVPALQLQVPIWVLSRRLEFRRMRTYQSIDPLVAFVVTIGLAAAGYGYWALVLGTLAGSWTGAALIWRLKPYPVRLEYDRGTLRSYVRFSAPLFVATLGGMTFAQVSILVGEDALGLAGAGAITLAAQISMVAQRVDDVLTSTLYPVICSVVDRRELLLETFTKSNRVALMWAMPFGVGLFLFAPDIIGWVLADRWEPAAVAVQVTGLVAGVSQLAFNWTSYFRAIGDTRPIAVNSVAQAIVFLATAWLMYPLGIDGFAIALGAVCAVNLATRAYFLSRLFAGFSLLRHALRAFAPSLPALAVVVLLRVAEGGGPRSDAEAALEIALYVAVTLAATWTFERALLREIVGYVRRRGPAFA